MFLPSNLFWHIPLHASWTPSVSLRLQSRSKASLLPPPLPQSSLLLLLPPPSSYSSLLLLLNPPSSPRHFPPSSSSHTPTPTPSPSLPLLVGQSVLAFRKRTSLVSALKVFGLTKITILGNFLNNNLKVGNYLFFVLFSRALTKMFQRSQNSLVKLKHCIRGDTSFKKHRKNCKTRPRELLISCQGVKMFLPKDPFKFFLLHKWTFLIIQVLSQF